MKAGNESPSPTTQVETGSHDVSNGDGVNNEAREDSSQTQVQVQELEGEQQQSDRPESTTAIG